MRDDTLSMSYDYGTGRYHTNTTTGRDGSVRLRLRDGTVAYDYDYGMVGGEWGGLFSVLMARPLT